MSVEVEEGQGETMSDNVDQEKTGIEVPPALSDYVNTCATGSMESFQDTHSLLLCPSQWTALLESPVSLVRHASETDCNREGNSLNDQEPSTIRNSPTLLERSVHYKHPVIILHNLVLFMYDI